MTTEPDTPNAQDGPSLSSLLAKSQAVAAKVTQLKRDFAGASRLAHAAQVREALTRTELTEAVRLLLVERAEMQARMRAQAVAAHAARGAVRLRRHNRISKRIDLLLARLGAFGQAVVIARSGVWRRGPHRLGDLRRMVAYARRGGAPGAAPPPPFDQAWYMATHRDVAGQGPAPLIHYLIAGASEGRSPGPLFDEAYYRAQNAVALASTGLSGLEHYLRAGAAQARDPHPLFDTAHYLAQSPAIAPGEDPLSHYLREGAGLGLSPHPLFDPAWYAKQTGAPGGLAHYLVTGWRKGLSPHPLFDPTWYAETSPEVAAAGSEPLTHFVSKGGFEGRSPSPWFDVPQYVAERGEGLPPGVNPLVDYLRGGAWAVSDAARLAAKPELVRAGLTPLENWVRRFGR